MENHVTRYRIHLVPMVLCLSLASCGGDFDEPTIALEDADALALVYAAKPTTPVLVVYTSGEALTTLSEDGGGAASSAVFAVPGLDPLVVEAGDDGLPTRAYTSGHTFIFRNWRQTKVDVGVVDLSGATQALPDVRWPAAIALPAFPNGPSAGVAAIRGGYDLIGAAACVIGQAAASLDDNVAFLVVGAACARLETKITVALLHENGDSSRWQEALDLADSSLVAAGCVAPASSTAINCADLVLAGADETVAEARLAAEAVEERIQQLANSLRHEVRGGMGGGRTDGDTAGPLRLRPHGCLLTGRRHPRKRQRRHGEALGRQHPSGNRHATGTG